MNDTDDSGFVLAESVARSDFDDDIYAHLGALAAVEFSRPGSDAQAGRFELTASKYEALEQAAFEEAPRMEAVPPHPVDWAAIDKRVAAFEVEVSQSLSKVSQAHPEVFVDFSSKCYENWLTYDQMYPESKGGGSNPWAGTKRVMQFGGLLVIGDQTQLRSNGGSRNARRKADSGPDGDDTSRMMALVKGAKARPAVMPVDRRFSQQAKLLSFLRTNANGHKNKIRLADIASNLQDSVGISMPNTKIDNVVRMIQMNLLVSLKRAGVVGSSSKGIFFISSEEDLIQSYCFHRTKVKSADKIMLRYQSRASDIKPGLVLDDECGKRGPVLNRRFWQS